MDPLNLFDLRLKLFEFDKIQAPLFFIQFQLTVFCQTLSDYRFPTNRAKYPWGFS